MNDLWYDLSCLKFHQIQSKNGFQNDVQSSLSYWLIAYVGAHSFYVIGCEHFPIIINFENLSKHKIKATRIK